MSRWRKTANGLGGAERGVTLMELLIAIAVFGILMSSIVALFVSSIRAARSGNQATDAYEESRGALDVVERDLRTAFTSRDYADYYSFFGMPYGFMFVGLVRGQRATSDDANLARVTYVLRRMDNQPTFETTIRDPGGGDPIDVTVETCSLLRIVEMGVEDLSSFNLGESGGIPTSWTDLRSDGDLDVDAIMLDLEGRHDPGDLADHTTEAVRTQMTQAVRRELWIRGLAGPDMCRFYDSMWQRADASGTPPVPQLAIDNPFFGYDPDRLPNMWTLLNLDPEDYVLADNILFRAYRTGDPTNLIEPGLYLSDSAGTESWYYFAYGRQAFVKDLAKLQASLSTWVTPLWCAEMNACELDGLGDAVYFDPYNVQLGSPLVPHLPEIVQMRLTFLYESPYPGAPDFRRRLQQVIDVPTGYVRTKRSDT